MTTDYPIFVAGEVPTDYNDEYYYPCEPGQGGPEGAFLPQVSFITEELARQWACANNIDVAVNDSYGIVHNFCGDETFEQRWRWQYEHVLHDPFPTGAFYPDTIYDKTPIDYKQLREWCAHGGGDAYDYFPRFFKYIEVRMG